MSKICDDLRAAILQAATQGKLTEQLQEDGNAEDLLGQIRAKKNTLNKRIKAIEDGDDGLFDIPDTWKWVRFGEVVDFSMGKTPPRAESTYWGNDIPWISIADMPENGILLDTKEKITDKALKERFGSKICPKNTLIMSFKLTVGRCSILGIDAVHNEAIISIYPVVDDEFTFRDFLARVLPFLSNYGETKDAIKGRTLNSDSLNNLLIPLPPLAEQKRIVKKVDELMARVADLEESADALASLKKAFPDDIKASLLQYAMQGKLTKQLPEDGNAEDLLEEIKAEKEKLIAEGKIKKQKPLAPIADDEIPFNIPENWKWVRVGEIFDHNTGKTKNASQNSVGTPRKYITTSNMYWNYFDFTKVGTMNFKDDELEKYTVKKGDLLVCEGGDFGRTAIWDQDEEVCFQNHIHRLRFFKDLSHKYFYWLFYFYKNTGLIKGKGIGIQGLSSGVLHNIAFPLPPLAEQKRIAERLESLMQNINTVGELIASEQSA